MAMLDQFPPPYLRVGTFPQPPHPISCDQEPFCCANSWLRLPTTQSLTPPPEQKKVMLKSKKTLVFIGTPQKGWFSFWKSFQSHQPRGAPRKNRATQLKRQTAISLKPRRQWKLTPASRHSFSSSACSSRIPMWSSHPSFPKPTDGRQVQRNQVNQGHQSFYQNKHLCTKCLVFCGTETASDKNTYRVQPPKEWPANLEDDNPWKRSETWRSVRKSLIYLWIKYGSSTTKPTNSN